MNFKQPFDLKAPMTKVFFGAMGVTVIVKAALLGLAFGHWLKAL